MHISWHIASHARTIRNDWFANHIGTGKIQLEARNLIAIGLVGSYNFKNHFAIVIDSLSRYRYHVRFARLAHGLFNRLVGNVVADDFDGEGEVSKDTFLVSSRVGAHAASNLAH